MVCIGAGSSAFASQAYGACVFLFSNRLFTSYYIHQNGRGGQASNEIKAPFSVLTIKGELAISVVHPDVESIAKIAIELKLKYSETYRPPPAPLDSTVAIPPPSMLVSPGGPL